LHKRRSSFFSSDLSNIILALALAEHMTASSWGPDERPDFLILEGEGMGEEKSQRVQKATHSLVHDVSMPFAFSMEGESSVRFTHEDSRENFVGGRGFGEERKELGFWDHFRCIYLAMCDFASLLL
jgi:hypothetical protein